MEEKALMHIRELSPLVFVEEENGKNKMSSRLLADTFQKWGIERVVATAWIDPAVSDLRKALLKAGLIDGMNPLLHTNPMRGVRNLWLT